MIVVPLIALVSSFVAPAMFCTVSAGISRAVTETGASDRSMTRLVVSPALTASETFRISSGFTSAIVAVPFSIVALTVVDAVLSPEPSTMPVKVVPLPPEGAPPPAPPEGPPPPPPDGC